jgi:hypothetical protein
MSEQSLWRAVITQALADAGVKLPVGAGRKVGAAKTDGENARDWLTRPNADFNHVCHLAGLEPEAVRALAERRIAIADGLMPAPIPKARPRRPRTPTPTPRRQRQPSPFNRGGIGAKPKLYTHDGRTMTLKQWSAHLGIHYQTLAHRLRQNWPIERVLIGETFRGRRRAPGVTDDLGGSLTTGGSSTAQETPQIDFPKQSNSR